MLGLCSLLGHHGHTEPGRSPGGVRGYGGGFTPVPQPRNNRCGLLQRLCAPARPLLRAATLPMLPSLHCQRSKQVWEQPRSLPCSTAHTHPAPLFLTPPPRAAGAAAASSCQARAGLDRPGRAPRGQGWICDGHTDLRGAAWLGRAVLSVRGSCPSSAAPGRLLALLTFRSLLRPSCPKIAFPESLQIKM